MGPPGHPLRRHLEGTGQPAAEPWSPALALGSVFLLREGPRFGSAAANTGCLGRTRAVLANPPGPPFESWGRAAGWRGDALSYFI